MPDVNGIVTGVSAAGPVALLAGSFSTVGGQSRPGVAVVDASTGAPFASRPLASGSANAAAFVVGAFAVGLPFSANGLGITTAGTVAAPSRRMGLVVVNGD